MILHDNKKLLTRSRGEKEREWDGMEDDCGVDQKESSDWNGMWYANNQLTLWGDFI